MDKGQRARQVLDGIIQTSMNMAKCIVVVNNVTKRYECIKSEDIFNNIISQSGTAQELYDILFLNNKTVDSEAAGEYKQFRNLSVFEKNQYRANLKFVVDNIERDYSIILASMNTDETAVIIMERDNLSDSDRIEQEKAETIQESYLFSMIVNLLDDSCINPNTTEVSSDRQDFMDIKYSDWRLMISKMFKEQDRVLFLRVSSPDNIINTLEIKPRFHIDLQMMNMQGQYAWSRLTFARMKNFSRKNPRFLYTVDDISEDMNQLLRQEGITKAVEEQNKILQREDKEKTRFFANLSHELRAPINVIMGMNEIILRNSKEEKIREYAEDIKSASKTLLQLVNDVLDFSKIQAGKMEIVPVEYETKELVKNTSKIISLMVQEKSLEYEVKIDDDVPDKLFGDEVRIAQILTNLLTNAVKYTDRGKVTLSIKTTRDAQGMDAIEYAVEDTGCGIRQEDMGKLFSTYGRLDLERNRRVEGTGLGIGIVTGLLEAMNSNLNVESEYGKGSRFSFVLTQNYVDDKSDDVGSEYSDTANKLDLSNKKILVVDDAPINLKVMEILLDSIGGKADTVDNGSAALEMMDKEEYDIVFLDHVMPGMDGIETLKRAREISPYYMNAIFVALTGNVSPSARDEYICKGFTDYLKKPITVEELIELLNMYIK